MKKRYGTIVAILIAGFLLYYFYWYLPYPVYEGEELLQSDVYPYTFVFFGDNRPAIEKGEFNQPDNFKTIIEMINKENPLFVVGGGDYVWTGILEDLTRILNKFEASKDFKVPEEFEVPEEFKDWSFRKILNDPQKQKVEEVLADLRTQGFDEFLDIVKDLNPPLFYVCGNHDHPGYEEFLEKAHTPVKEKVYAFTYKNDLFVVLDNSFSYLKEMDRKQLKFLEKLLKKDYNHTFVFVHVPPFDPREYNKSSEDEGLLQWIRNEVFDGDPIHKMRYPEEFMEIIREYEVDYVFCSHIHSFFEERIYYYGGEIYSCDDRYFCEGEACSKCTVYIISGGAGAPLIEGGFYHYIVVEVGDEVTYTVVKCDACSSFTLC